MDAIELTSVVKDFGDVRAIDDLDLAIETGRITAVLGANGAGKTTATGLMLGLRRPTRGTVRVLGAAPDSPGVRGRVGAMLQDPGFPQATTCGELLGLVAVAYRSPRSVAEVIDRVGLTGQADRRIAQLSGGQRQRVAFGVALVGDPELFFLDEPTVGLDVQGRRRFWDHLVDLSETGRTIMFTTHYLAEADAVADRVVVIDDGRLVADGTPHQIKQLVAGRTVALTTTLAPAELLALPAVAHIADPANDDTEHPSSRRVALHTGDADALIAALVRSGHPLTDLTVQEADLEDAFVHVTSVA